VANPHITPPTVHDLQCQLPPHRAWPQPLPEYIPRRLPAPDWIPPPSIHTPHRLSQRGVRKQLRTAGPYAEGLVHGMEGEIMDWLERAVIVNPDEQSQHRKIGTQGSIYEISRTHAQLIWSTEDAFARYVLHCISRYHGLVSYSKESEQGRVTHILRPRVQINRPGVAPLYTPSATDLDSGSEVLVSDVDLASDGGLSALVEEDGDYVDVGREAIQEEDSSSDILVGDSSETASPSVDMIGSVNSMMDSLTLDEATPRPARIRVANRTQVLRNPIRSGSSPSRSPARLSRSGRSSPYGSIRGQPLRVLPTATVTPGVPPTTFWAYLYA